MTAPSTVWRRPVLAAGVVVAMAIAVGLLAASTAVLRAVVLDPFPYPHSDRLVLAWGSKRVDARRGLSGEIVERWRTLTKTLEGLAVFYPSENAAVPAAYGQPVYVSRIEASVLVLLDVPPVLGRRFNEDDTTASESVAVISFGAWQRWFGGSEGAVGSVLQINDTSRVVVGIMPQGFFFPERSVDVWLPFSPSQLQRESATDPKYLVLARLNPGALAEVAQQELDSLHVADRSGSTSAAGVFPIMSLVANDHGRALWTLTGAIGALFLMIVLNQAALLTLHGHERRRDFAIRVAHGATGRTLFGHVLIEQGQLAICGAIGSVIVARATLAIVRELSLSDVGGLENATLDAWTLVFIAGVVTMAGAASAAAACRPAMAMSVARILGSDGSGDGPRRGVTFRASLMSQLVIAPSLLVAAVLLGASFVRASSADWGFRPSGAGLLQLRLPREFNRQLSRQNVVMAELLAEINRLPGVQHAGLTYSAPIRYGRYVRRAGDSIEVEGGTLAETPLVIEIKVGDGYFFALGAPILKGREFSQSDHEHSEPVAVVSSSFAQRAWPDREPLGQTLRIAEAVDSANIIPDLLKDIELPPPEIRWTVVGVVPDIRMFTLEMDPLPAIYLNYRQQRRGFFYGSTEPTLVVKAQPDAEISKVLRSAAGLVRETRHDIAVVGIHNLHDLIDHAVGGRGTRRLLAFALPLFASLGVVLLFGGTFAALYYGVQRREREIGVRVALGAEPRQILGFAIRGVGGTAALALSVGLTAALGVSRMLRHLVFGTRESDPETWAFAIAALFTTVIAAVLWPAKRALSVNAADLLRKP